MDLAAVERFRSEMRPSSSRDFRLSSAPSIFRGGRLARRRLAHPYRHAALRPDPTSYCPTAIVKCTRYYGADRGVTRDNATYEDTVPDQIVKAREFIAARARVGERRAPARRNPRLSTATR